MSKQNKELFLGHIATLQFNDKIIIALEEKWKNFFQDISFKAIIDKNGRYTLVGPEVYRNRLSDPTVEQEDTVDG